MPHTIEFTDAAGKRPASPQTVALQTAKPKEVGLFLKSLGLAVSRQTNSDGQTYLAAQCPGLTISVTVAPQPSDPNAHMLHFTIDSLTSVVAAAEAQFGQVAMKPFDTQWGRRAIVADAEGRRYVITEMTAASETAVGAEPTVEVGANPFAISVTSSPGKSSTLAPIDPEELKALGAVKRGSAVVLIGIALQMLTAVAILVTVFSASSRGGRANVQALNEKLAAYGILLLLGVVATIAGKVMCAIPNTSRVSYAPLWTAVGLEVFTVLLNIVAAFLPDVDFMIPRIVVGLLGLIAPFVFVQFLGSIMEQIRSRSVADLAKTTNTVFGIWLVSVAASIVFVMLMPQLFTVILFVIALVSLVYTGFYITLLVQVLTAKTTVRGAR